MRKTLALALAVSTLTAATTVGMSQAATASTAKKTSRSTTASTVHWRKCPPDLGTPIFPLPPTLQCATLKVPLDYRHPNGRKIDLAISRLPSTTPSKRRGVLLVNPGGPAPGLNYPAMLTNPLIGLPKNVREDYDLIGFDPRGIGHSTPVTCDLTAEQQRYGNVPPYAHNVADVAQHAKDTKQIAKQCATSKTAWMLPYVNAANVARDMDQIRIALGEPRISYYGASWGTYLGAVYTTLFPQRSDRIVLDSNLGPDGWDYQNDIRFAQGFADRFPDFATYAAANDREYGLGHTPAQVRAKYFELAARLDKHPIQGADVRYTGTMFRLITYTQLYSYHQMPTLAKIWRALDKGQEPPPLPTGGGDAAAKADNLISGRYYMICSNAGWPRSVQTYQRHVAIERVRHPMFGAAGANIQPCAFWPKPIEPPVHIGHRGPSNVLMVQNLRDPATPLSGARQLRRAFGDRARMVTVDQGGHGVYLENPNECANHAVTSFLTTGKRPAHDYTCTAAAAPH
ncbi:MAG: alpha/beta hydrolase [Sciscionella sp.]